MSLWIGSLQTKHAVASGDTSMTDFFAFELFQGEMVDN